MNRWKLVLAGGAVILALGVWLVGRPTLQDRLEPMTPELDRMLASGDKHIDPRELLDLIYNANFGVRILDLRCETDFNLFHILDAERVTLDHLQDPAWVQALPKKTVFVLTGNGDERAEQAFRLLSAWKVPNLYILSGGINRWVEIFAPRRQVPAKDCQDPGCRRYLFEAALGDRHPASDPGAGQLTGKKFPKKVKPIGRTVRKAGGCG